MTLRRRPRLASRLGSSGGAARAMRGVYLAWLQTIHGRRGVPWTFNGEAIRIDPRVRHLVPREAEVPLFEFLRSQIRPGDVVLDVGAFLGVYAICLARWAGPEGRVVAFEPTPASAAVGRCHLAMNGFGPGSRVTFLETAAGSKDGRTTLSQFAEPYRNTLASWGHGIAACERTCVRVVTLDRTCHELGLDPDWIRMDVQGAEFDVLRGARETLRRGRSRLRIVIEMHPAEWSSFGMDAASAADLLAALGLRARPLVPGRHPFEQDGHAELEWLPS